MYFTLLSLSDNIRSTFVKIVFQNAFVIINENFSFAVHVECIFHLVSIILACFLFVAVAEEKWIAQIVIWHR